MALRVATVAESALRVSRSGVDVRAGRAGEDLDAVLVDVADRGARDAELFRERRLLLTAVDAVNDAATVTFTQVPRSLAA